MKRRKIFWITSILVVANLIAFAQEGRKISTKNYQLTVDELNGNVKSIIWKPQPGIQVIKEPRLAENFRLLLPLPGYEANYFYSKDQKISSIEEIENGVVFHYNTIKNSRQQLDVTVLYKIIEINDQLQFTIDVNNPGSQPLAEVYFGIIGGQQGLLNKADTKTLITGPTTNNAPDLFNNFRAGGFGGGNLGITYSANGFTYPSWQMVMPWMEIYNPKARVGLYYANQDTIARLSNLYFELRPYNKSVVVGDNWPTVDDVPANEPIGLTMGWVNFPYTTKARFHSGTVVLQVHEGDWHEGSRIYRSWFDKNFPVKREPTWLRNEQAWQSIIISNSEDEIKYTFKDLPALAADAKKYGVTTFEILGWDIGGIDRGYPQYTPDPKLGTHEEFIKALSDIKKLGVHPLIFTNIQWSDTHIPLYKKELFKYTKKGKWEDDLSLAGWGEGTISARLGYTRSNMTLVSPSHEPFKQLLLKQYYTLIKDGADGFQFDKGLSIDMDFNPLLKTSPDRSFPDGLLKILNTVLQEGRKIQPNLSIASESTWDRMFPYIDVSYMRMNDIDMNPSLKYTFPEWTATIFAETPGDINIMNNGMRYGLVWALAPRHYNKSMDDSLSRKLSGYVGELIRIRSEYKDILFHGRFCDTSGALVKGGEYVRYSVFERMTDSSKKACVIVNFGNSVEKVNVKFLNQGSNTNVAVLQPFQKDYSGNLPDEITLPPRTCAVVVIK